VGLEAGLARASLAGRPAHGCALTQGMPFMTIFKVSLIALRSWRCEVLRWPTAKSALCLLTQSGVASCYEQQHSEMEDLEWDLLPRRVHLSQGSQVMALLSCALSPGMPFLAASFPGVAL